MHMLATIDFADRRSPAPAQAPHTAGVPPQTSPEVPRPHHPPLTPTLQDQLRQEIEDTTMPEWA
eukprot:2457885-Pleurochrysis_carterae.AAC.1